jgi:putative nucleotidyltransferase with HDIG domain
MTVRTVRVHEARDVAQAVLRGLPSRWRHTVGVARRAEELAATLDADDGEQLVAAAWLHDIGYAGDLVDTGFHSLDGARFLDRHRWPSRISALVAHHSGAVFVATARGLDHELRRYPREESSVSDALTYADQTTGPNGERMAVARRMADMLRRHGPESPSACVHHVRGPYLLAVAERVERRLRSSGVSRAGDPRR